MNIPATPKEAKELEKKMKANQEADDWVETIFPMAGLPDLSKSRIGRILKKIGDDRVPKSK